jgi:hypothetical protein
MSTLLRVALGLTLAAAQPAAATVTVNVERDADSIGVGAIAVMRADADTAWRVLTDYDRYVEFIPELRLRRVVARRGATVTVEQSGFAAMWMLRIPVHITFEINEIPPHRLHSRAVAGSLPTLTSCYALTPFALGIRLDYVGRLASNFGFLGSIERTAVEQNIARQFQALADEIERKSAETLSRSVEGARHEQQHPQIEAVEISTHASSSPLNGIGAGSENSACTKHS